MEPATIGVLHPGEMGAAVGAALRAAGHEVLWASAGRGAATARRAAEAGLEDVGHAGALAGRAAVLLSVCPPHAARDVARSVAGFRGVYVDANAIAPATARELGAAVEAAGARFVDGGIVGPPPAGGATTNLLLSGPDADAVARLFAGTPVRARALSAVPGHASAAKAAYAAWTKGTAALLLAVRALARAEGVEAALLAEWEHSLPELPERSLGAASSAARKGWRWVGEMEEIADAFAAAGLPDGFHRAAAEVFRRVPGAEPDAAADEATLERIVAALRPGRA